MSRSQKAERSLLVRMLDQSAVGDGGLRQTIVADEAERRDLATLGGLAVIESLTADLLIRRDGRHGLRVTGEVRSRVRQTCVVSLEDFDADLIELADIRFLPLAEIEAEIARRAALPAGAEELEDDLADPIVNGRIDLGGVVAELFALGLDPYPKKPGRHFEEPALLAGDSGAVSPFAVLAKFKTP